MGFTRPPQLKIVEKEFSRKDRDLIPVYRSLPHARILGVNRGVKKLASSYKEKLSLEAADATVLATACIGKVDVLLSWNRDDLVKAKTCSRIKAINRGKDVCTPVICTPSYFIDHLRLSKGTKNASLELSRSPVLSKDRLRIFRSK